MGHRQVILICLTGAARAGKDSVADRLVERHGFTKISFAAPLKQALRATDPILGFHPYKPGELVRLSEALANETEDAIKQLFPEYRRLLEKLGTEGIRAIDDEFWVREAFNRAGQSGNNRIVFPDARFSNEVDAVRYGTDGISWAGTTEAWHVVRPSLVGPVGEQHASAVLHGNLGEDREVLNDSTLDDLHSIVDAIIEDLEGK
ncbi:hypothetical protein J2X12_002916 [Pseudarthrobacter oxydans]|uniref:Uncharacterized protein n=1 Tax=Pseudarthrobacter oxydans TaxID=1671 RepID=A0AAW8NB85_PSEOX|nr:hypothetical protein [Pseudarthrobacter oxydans]MDR6794347.1 hypothetical protein [Pseudarthrobacter oxydans]MDR7164878.1 hypothetical protein [Pseudarthrobacter oxydans]